ncbi:MAG: ImmA/IrrE family metallo-endopeptidase, partial [Hyphomicrobium sp.]
MTAPRSPTRWATDISAILNRVRGADHFPIVVPEIAHEYSKSVFPDDPISLIQGDNLPGFDGALLRAPPGKRGWGIIYNNGITSKGRINFTLAHEFGHYLNHRLQHPNGMQCSQQDVVRWDSAYGQIEQEANTFAAYLLMPLDDYRRQIGAGEAATLELLTHCANRYEVSLVAATLRWLAYTEKRAVLAVSRAGFILWARSSGPAFNSGVFIKTSGRPPIPVPEGSVANRPAAFAATRTGVDHPPGLWFKESCRELSIVSENYDFTLSLLQLSSSSGVWAGYNEDEAEPEGLDNTIRRIHN